MSRPKKKTPQALELERPAVRSNLHQILATRKSGRHKSRAEKRAAQKLRRELDEG